MAVSSSPFSSVQDIRHVPLSNVPVVIKADTAGSVRIRALGFLGRFKVAFLGYLKRTTRESQTTHEQFRQFLTRHYGENLTRDALAQVGLSVPASRRHALTSRQVHQALGYVRHQHQLQRLRTLKEGRDMAHRLIWDAPFSEPGHESSRDYQALRDMCYKLRPPVDIRTMKPEQWRCARSCLTRYVYLKSRRGADRISEKEAIKMGAAMLAQASELGVEGCEKVLTARHEVRKTMETFFKALEQGDKSDIVQQLLRISQTAGDLQKAEMAQVHPKAEGYISRTYAPDALTDSMLSHLEDNAKISPKSIDAFQDVLSSLKREGITRGMRDVVKRQKLEGILSKEMSQHMGRATTMLERLQKGLGAYSKDDKDSASSPPSDAFPHRDVADQLRIYGGAKVPNHFARVRHARVVLSQARDRLRQNGNAPSCLAISEKGRGNARSDLSLNFLRLALKSALETDKSVAQLRRLTQQRYGLQESMRKQKDTFFAQQELAKLTQTINTMRERIPEADSDYAQLYQAVEQFSTDVSQHLATPLSDEEKYYQNKLERLLVFHAPENLLFTEKMQTG